ncbi:MAG: cytochrome c oxidase subunit II [Gemmatimonadaceae bacterium]|nr:cytochrome c oxidase subunit II [Gemmatimonadaceae bacterium]
MMLLQAVHTQSSLDPVGPLAANTARLWWFALAVATVVYLLVIATACWALARARRRERRGELLDPGGEGRMTTGVTWSIAATVVILLVFLGYDLSVGRTLSPIPKAHPLTIEVTGHQWWWEVQYADSAVHDRFTTANEIHVPVGQPVLFLLTAADVIHSMWVPNLAGKKDLVPGYTQSFWFKADTAGTYRGQCAEFCGHQHAKMAMFIIAEPLQQYQTWVAGQRDTASTPTDSVAARGHTVFMTGTCAMCHNIEGTTAGSHAGPDLTHLASRRTIAAGTLPNTRGNLAGWIVDPQRIKPGAKMPPNQLRPSDLDALLTYLQSLK